MVVRCVRVSVRVWCAVDRGLANNQECSNLCVLLSVSRMRTGRKCLSGRGLVELAHDVALQQSELTRGDTALKFLRRHRMQVLMMGRIKSAREPELKNVMWGPRGYVAHGT